MKFMKSYTGKDAYNLYVKFTKDKISFADMMEIISRCVAKTIKSELFNNMWAENNIRKVNKDDIETQKKLIHGLTSYSFHSKFKTSSLAILKDKLFVPEIIEIIENAFLEDPMQWFRHISTVKGIIEDEKLFKSLMIMLGKNNNNFSSDLLHFLPSYNFCNEYEEGIKKYIYQKMVKENRYTQFTAQTLFNNLKDYCTDQEKTDLAYRALEHTFYSVNRDEKFPLEYVCIAFVNYITKNSITISDEMREQLRALDLLKKLC